MSRGLKNAPNGCKHQLMLLKDYGRFLETSTLLWEVLENFIVFQRSTNINMNI